MAKMVSERISIADFFKGLTCVRVDYATREYSRCYRWGVNTAGTLFVLVPIALVLGIGVIVGALLCRGAAAADLPPIMGPMTFGESAELGAALKRTKPATLTIACAGPWCQRASDDLARAFEGAGWKVVRMNQGGLGIDGVAGVRVHPCDPVSAKLAAALLAGRRPYEVVQEKCAPGDRDIFVILGDTSPSDPVRLK